MRAIFSIIIIFNFVLCEGQVYKKLSFGAFAGVGSNSDHLFMKRIGFNIGISLVKDLEMYFGYESNNGGIKGKHLGNKNLKFNDIDKNEVQHLMNVNYYGIGLRKQLHLSEKSFVLVSFDGGQAIFNEINANEILKTGNSEEIQYQLGRKKEIGGNLEVCYGIKTSRNVTPSIGVGYNFNLNLPSLNFKFIKYLK
jgi:hypothetical protein